MSLSTDQLAAFVALARQGSLRAAAERLAISEQGLRGRLLVLEQRLGCELYRKGQGPRRAAPLTAQGKTLLPLASDLLERAGALAGLFGAGGAGAAGAAAREIAVVASQYLIGYVLLDTVKRFHAAYPAIRVQLSARRERDIEAILEERAEVAFGVAAPYDPPPEIEYTHLFSMRWSLIAPAGHPLARRRGPLSLAALARVPLIFYERGSTGRQHVIEAFHASGIQPRVEMESTNTDLIVRMVEAGLGAAIVPLLPSGAVTRGRRVGVRPLREAIRPIRSGILTRRGEPLAEAARTLVEFIREDAARLESAAPPRR